ncbi:MAG: hypothetical protein AB7E72_13555 [Lysobacterales bacterium]
MNPDLMLTLDFGEVGYHYNREPFCVRLDAEALETLIADACNAYRVYELTLIQRPGDVWDYVHVVPEAVPGRVAERLETARADAMPRLAKVHPWPEGKVAFAVFDKFFYYAWDDTEPDSEAWLGARGSDRVVAFADRLFATAQAALAKLEEGDPLMRHELHLARTHRHWCSHEGFETVVERFRNPLHTPKPPAHSPGYYDHLEALLRDPDLVSVAYRGRGDWPLMRLLCAEQRRRVDATGHSQIHALHLSASTDYRAGVDAWDGRIWFFSEGLAHGDLLIDGPGHNGVSAKQLIEKYRRRPQVVLTDAADFEIDGYSREIGDGWTVFRRSEPRSRRQNMELIASRRQPDDKPVIQFEGEGSSVYPFDRGLIVLGDGLSAAAISAVTTLIQAWRDRDGELLIIATGEISKWSEAGIDGPFQVPDTLHADSEAEQANWVSGLLRDKQTWTDVAMLLGAPEWIARSIHAALASGTRPWAPWIVQTDGIVGARVDLVLDADPAIQLSDPFERASVCKPLLR